MVVHQNVLCQRYGLQHHHQEIVESPILPFGAYDRDSSSTRIYNTLYHIICPSVAIITDYNTLSYP
jgi:hypothetical protein